MRLLIVLLLISGAMLSAVPRNKRQSGTNSNAGRFGNFGSQSTTGDRGTVSDDRSVTKRHGCEGPGTTCVPYYRCDNGAINIDGTGLFDIRVGSPCPRYLDVCCRKPNINIPPPTPNDPNYRSKCGRRNYNGIGARVHSLDETQSQFGEFPWMVAILRVEVVGSEEINLYLCGGSLIAPNIVLTAAHCVLTYGASNLKVRAGEWDTQSVYERYPHQDLSVVRTIIHPEFDEGSLRNDFALLVLQNNFLLGPNVDTICIPSPAVIFRNPKCLSTGWGKDQFGIAGRFQSILKRVDLPIVAHNVCEKKLQSTRLGEHFVLDNSFLCAGGVSGTDTCKGDGGSPYVCSAVDGTYYQVGIVAWGIGCGENGVPGVYADVTKFATWIRREILQLKK